MGSWAQQGEGPGFIFSIQVVASLLSHPSPRKPTPAKSQELLSGGVNLLINSRADAEGTQSTADSARTGEGVLR